MLLVESALLMRYRRVDAVGISGGAERLIHFLALHVCNLRTAYVARHARLLWMVGDYDTRIKGNSLGMNVQWADIAHLGIRRGIDVVFGVNSGEGRLAKAGLQAEFLPGFRRSTGAFSVHGSDVLSDGPVALAHEIDLEDYLHYLDNRRGRYPKETPFASVAAPDLVANSEVPGPSKAVEADIRGTLSGAVVKGYSCSTRRRARRTRSPCSSSGDWRRAWPTG